MIPGMLVSVIGSILLGIALLRDDYAPQLTAWLLALAFPLLLIASSVLRHYSLGMVPIFVAWAATGWQLWPATSRRERESVPGLWVARQLAWQIEFLRSPRGFTARIWR